MCIIDLVKIRICELHYYYIKSEFGNNSRLLFTDTNTLVYEIKTKDAYENFSEDKGMFDYSYYSSKSKHYDDSNKLGVGEIKDEMVGAGLEDFVRLKPKMY